MEGQPARLGDAAAAIGARRGGGVSGEMRQCIKLARDRRDFAGDAVHRGHHHRAAAVARQPGDAAQMLRHLALAAIAIHRAEESLVAETPGVLVARGGFDIAAERIGERELILDVGAGEPLLERFIRAAVRHRHALAVLPEECAVLVAGKVIGVRGDEGGKDGVGTSGCGGEGEEHED